jgi:hypothetical protein
LSPYFTPAPIKTPAATCRACAGPEPRGYPAFCFLVLESGALEDAAMKATIPLLAFAFGLLIFPNQARAEIRSAKDMQKECRIALAVAYGTVDRNPSNAVLTGECIGYVQGVVDASMALAENVNWYKVCMPDDVPTQSLIEKFIAFVDANPKYTLASTAIEMMLAQSYPCRK